MLKKYVQNFFAKYPKEAHIAAAIIVGLSAIYKESPTAQADVGLVINSLPHHAQWLPLAALLLKLFYSNNEK